MDVTKHKKNVNSSQSEAANKKPQTDLLPALPDEIWASILFFIERLIHKEEKGTTGYTVPMVCKSWNKWFLKGSSRRAKEDAFFRNGRLMTICTMYRMVQEGVLESISFKANADFSNTLRLVIEKQGECIIGHITWGTEQVWDVRRVLDLPDTCHGNHKITVPRNDNSLLRAALEIGTLGIIIPPHDFTTLNIPLCAYPLLAAGAQASEYQKKTDIRDVFILNEKGPTAKPHPDQDWYNAFSQILRPLQHDLEEICKDHPYALDGITEKHALDLIACRNWEFSTLRRVIGYYMLKSRGHPGL